MQLNEPIFVWRIIAQTYKLLFSNFLYLLRISFLPILAFLIIDWIALVGRINFMSQLPDEFMTLSISTARLAVFEILGFLKFLCLVPIAVCWHRFILLNRKEGYFVPRLSKIVWHYSRLVILLGGGYAFFFVIAVFLPFKVIDFWDQQDMLEVIVFHVALLTFGWIIIAPISLVLPALVARDHAQVSDFCRIRIEDHAKIFFTLCMVTLPFTVFYMTMLVYNYTRVIAVLNETPEALGRLILNIMREGILLAAPVTITSTFVFITSISLIYKHNFMDAELDL